MTQNICIYEKVFAFSLLGVKRSKEGSKRKIIALLNKLHFRSLNQFTVDLKRCNILLEKELLSCFMFHVSLKDMMLFKKSKKSGGLKGFFSEKWKLLLLVWTNKNFFLLYLGLARNPQTLLGQALLGRHSC